MDLFFQTCCCGLTNLDFLKTWFKFFFSFSVIVNDDLRNEWDFPLENFKEIGECRKNNRTTLSLKKALFVFPWSNI